jgi:MoxR-like ATPase
MKEEDWGLLARNVKRHINTMILGPAGSGKTSCVKILCERLGIKLHIFDMGSMMDPISSLLGVHRLEAGASIFDYAKFTQVIQEPCVILLDELSRAPQSAMNILFPCLDDRRSLSVEIACGKGIREIKIHPDVSFIATANVGAEYSGTNSMDRALVNRFFTLELGYIPEKEESAVLCNRTGIAEDISKLIVKIANNIRSLSSKQEVSTCPSIRETLMVAELVADGWELRQAMQMVYLPLYEGTKSEGERGTIFKTLSSY